MAAPYQKQATQQSSVCGKAFVPRKSNAVTRSSACRQKGIGRKHIGSAARSSFKFSGYTQWHVNPIENSSTLSNVYATQRKKLSECQRSRDNYAKRQLLIHERYWRTMLSFNKKL